MVCRLESILFLCDFIKQKWETKGQKERLQERRFYCLRTTSVKRGTSHGILSTMKTNFTYNQHYWLSLALLFAIWLSLRRNHYLGVLQFHSIWEVKFFFLILYLKKPIKQNDNTYKEKSEDISNGRIYFLTLHHKVAEHMNIALPFCSTYHFCWNIKHNCMFIYLFKEQQEF